MVCGANFVEGFTPWLCRTKKIELSFVMIAEKLNLGKLNN
jgi:hypothetical protein